MLHFCQKLSLNLPFIELSIPDKTIGIGQKNKMENKKKSGYVHKIIIYSVNWHNRISILTSTSRGIERSTDHIRTIFICLSNIVR